MRCEKDDYYFYNGGVCFSCRGERDIASVLSGNRLDIHEDLQRVQENERLREVVEGVAYGTDNRGGWGDCSEAKEFLKVAGIFDSTHYGLTEE